MPSPVTTASAPHTAPASARRARRSSRSLDLLAHVGDVEVRDRAGAGEQRGGALGVVGVDVDLERRRVADDEHRVADLLERARRSGACSRPVPVTAKFVQ